MQSFQLTKLQQDLEVYAHLLQHTADGLLDVKTNFLAFRRFIHTFFKFQNTLQFYLNKALPN